MKQFLSLVLAFVLLLSLSACSQPEEPEVPVNFYYTRAQYSYGDEDGVIAAEIREAKDLTAEEILSLYLKGPLNEQFTTLFPDGVELCIYEPHSQALDITLSSEFAQLIDLDLTLACACLTLTCAELFDVSTVTVSAMGTLLDGQQQITMNVDSIILFDESTLGTTSTTADE